MSESNIWNFENFVVETLKCYIFKEGRLFAEIWIFFGLSKCFASLLIFFQSFKTFFTIYQTFKHRVLTFCALFFRVRYWHHFHSTVLLESWSAKMVLRKCELRLTDHTQGLYACPLDCGRCSPPLNYMCRIYCHNKMVIVWLSKKKPPLCWGNKMVNQKCRTLAFFEECER